MKLECIISKVYYELNILVKYDVCLVWLFGRKYQNIN